MILCLVLLFLPVSAAFAWWSSRYIFRRFEVEAVPYFISAFFLSLLPGVLWTVLLGVLGALAYDGNCYGFTDSVRPCTWSEFAGNQFAGAALIGVPLTLLSLGLNMTLFYLRWRAVVL